MRHSRFSPSPRRSWSRPCSCSPSGPLAACSSPAASSPSAGGETHTVTITGNSFGDDFTIAAGDSVVFVNDAGVDHTVTNGVEGTANEDALFNVELATGETSDPIVFDEPGHVRRHLPHPSVHAADHHRRVAPGV